nr:ATP-dependent DNA helicase RecG [Coralloluteibacterium stylophorae]
MTPPVDPAAAPLGDLPGCGPRTLEKLAARGVLTLQDLWLHLPLRYEDRTRVVPIRALAGGPAQVEGRITAVESGFRFRPQLKVAVEDESGATLLLRFFHFHRTQVASFGIGRRIRVYGEARFGAHGPEIVHPSYRLLDEADPGVLSGALDPVYPAIEGIGAASVARLVAEAMRRLPPGEALELLPAAWRTRLGLPTLCEALALAHRPPAGTDLAALAEGRHPALQRLVFEELLAHHISLRRQRIAMKREGARAIASGGELAARLRAALPFSLTSAQERVFAACRHDLAQASPMLRLVQGDVGSGKTVVAALAALLAVEAGRQVALMAPTELLAEQHLANFAAWLEPLGVRVVWLAGKLGTRARTQALAAIADGSAQVVIGTHALMQEHVAFHDLALAIVDEQHRFGVHQRLALRDKGADGRCVPHQLVMTATPIPRTLAMTAYADLDVSVIDELPPGRTPVQTVAVSAERRAEVVERIRGACSDGRQAYWVCTLIEDSAEVEAQAAQSTFDQLMAQLPGLRIGLVHGRLKAAQKQETMRAFKAREFDVLVATTVIEVGVDVPNASLMLIENAERLGLAQLHQLRGRVGRGAAASTCVLLYQPPLSAMARERIEAMRASNDGFVIAEKDLALRGPGELLGARQTGLAGFRIADLARDAALLPAVRDCADVLLAEDPARADRLVARWVGGAARYAGA